MDPSPGLGALSSPALLVLTSSAEPTRGLNTPCQQQARHFGVPMGMDKPGQMPFLSSTYSLMYHHPERLGSAGREYPPPLLSLHPQFGHPGLDCGGVGMLGYGALHPFPPFHLSENMECFQAGYLSAKRPKMLSTSEPPRVRYLTLEKELEAQRAQRDREAEGGGEGLSPGAAKYRGSPSSRHTIHKRDRKVESVQPLFCPLCHRSLQRGELIDHLQYEMGTLSTQTHLSDSEPDTPHDEEPLSVQSPAAGGAAHEFTESPRGSPRVSEEGPKVDRQQSFQQVKSNREARLGARAGRCKRMKGGLEDQLAGSLLRVPRLGEAEDELSEGSRWGDDDYRTSRKGFLEIKESQVSTPRSMSSREGDVDPESDGDEQPPFPPHKFLPPESLTSPVREEGPSANLCLDITMNGEEELLGMAAKTMHTLKAQIQELTQRLLRTDAYKCHICLDSYAVPLASIQCWHIHCEQCWLRTLGTKKLCPQCHTITSPADLRRVYL